MSAKLNFYQSYVVEEYAEEYRAHRIGRRELLQRVLLVTGSVTLTSSALTALGCSSGDDDDAAPQATSTQAPPPAEGAQPSGAGPGVPANDPAIQASDVRWTGPATEVLGYLARPNRTGQFPAVIVIHENRGLLEHFKDVSRRYAKEGFVALAVDLVSRRGGSKPDPAANLGFTQTPAADLVADMLSAVAYLKQQGFVKADALGVTGFCFGGGMAWELAIASPEIRAAVPYYGSVRLLDQLGRTNAAVLAIYGQNDTRITGQSAEVEQRLRAAGKTVSIKVYPGANHAFFNDTGGSYDAEAAKEAWAQTIAWFRQHLGSG